MTWLVGIGTAVPEFAHAQTTIQTFMDQLIALPPAEKAFLAKLYTRSGINTRHSVIPDYGCKPAQRQLYPASENLEPFPSLSQRMACFNQTALPLGLKAIADCLAQSPAFKKQDITHIIAVTCTGLSAPGLDLMLLKALELEPSTQRTGVYFMGCYAALHGLKMADAICRSDAKAVVLVVCVELCTLHFQKDPSPDNLTANMLFADGAAAALLCGESRRPAGQKWQLDGFASEVALNGWSDMAWNVSEVGFLMKLSAYVPDLLRAGIGPLIQKTLSQLNLTQPDIQHWAIHPGGRKILDVVEDALQLPPLEAARTVLADYGNMSSPTVLFVLAQMWRHHVDWTQPERLLAAAFGPGLTLETALFAVVP